MPSEALVNEDLHESTRAWWLFMLVGLISIAAGVVVLAKPANSLATLAVIAGLLVLVDGIFDLMTSLSSHTENRGLAAVLGVLSAVVGILLIRHPFGGVLAIALLVGIWLASSGVVRLVRSFERDHRMTNILVALIEVAAGIVLVASPAIAYATLALLVGIAFIADGVATFALGWVMHGLRHDAESPAPLGTGMAA